MKKTLAILLALTLALSLCACGSTATDSSSSSSSQSDTEKPEIPKDALDVHKLGIALTLPDPMKEQMGTLIFADTYEGYEMSGVKVNGSLVLLFQSPEVYQRVQELQKNAEELSTEEYQELSKQTREFCSIISMDTDSVKSFLEGGGNLYDVTGYQHNDLLEERGKTSYYMAYDDMDSTDLSESSAAIYQSVLDALPALRENIILYTPEQSLGFQSGDKLTGIDAKDFSGNTFTEADFAKNKITLVNVWGTFCPPCIEEMPDLEKLHQDYKDKGLGVLGICSDTDGETNFDKGQKVIEKTGVTYQNLIPDDTLQGILNSEVDAIPTTFFVNSEGVVVGKFFVGKRTYDQLQTEIDELLK